MQAPKCRFNRLRLLRGGGTLGFAGGLEDKKLGGYAGIGGQGPQDTCHCEGVERPSQSQSSEIFSVISCSGTLLKRTYLPIDLLTYSLKSITHPLYSPPLKGGDMERFSFLGLKDEFNFCSGTLPIRTYRIRRTPLTLTLSLKGRGNNISVLSRAKVNSLGRGDNIKFPKRTYSPIDLLTYSLKKKHAAFTLAGDATRVALPNGQCRSAFTLAEVLITLGIIGVVAAMTLPVVINNARNKQLEAGLKKGASAIAQALDMYAAENGERITTYTITQHQLKPKLIPYFKVIKDCGWGRGAVDADDEACIKNYSSDLIDTTYTNFNGTNTISLSPFDDGQFVINDGMLILLENVGQGGANIYISVDVNGYKKAPNRLGQDLFMFQLGNEGELLPMGAPNTVYYTGNDAYCSNTSTTSMNGAGCTYKALSEPNFWKSLPR